MGSSAYALLYTCVAPTVQGMLVPSKQLPSCCLPQWVPVRLLPGRAGPQSHPELQLTGSPGNRAQGNTLTIQMLVFSRPQSRHKASIENCMNLQTLGHCCATEEPLLRSLLLSNDWNRRSPTEEPRLHRDWVIE